MTVNPTPAQPPTPVSSNFFTSKPFIILVLTGIVLCGGIAIIRSISEKTVLSFSFTIDGKGLSAGTVPVVKVDGQPFTSGHPISIGSHTLSAQLQDVEPFEKHCWVLFGPKNLGALPLESSKGSLVVSANPSPATVVVQRAGQTVIEGAVPLTVNKLPVGSYSLVFKRGNYTEYLPVVIQRQQQAEVKVALNLGAVFLFSEPTDADFDLSGKGGHWQGMLPFRVDDAPVGNYTLITRRKGWELNATMFVHRGITVTNLTEFPYGSIEVTSVPVGLVVTTNSIVIGKTPTILRELRTGQYTLTATDGTNDFVASVNVGPKEMAKHLFVLRYGAIHLDSTPPNAAVIRKGKEIGKTPLILDHIPCGELIIELRLQGYESTNLLIQVSEGEAAKLTARLFSEQYLQAMKLAREAGAMKRFPEAQKHISTALEYEPNDSAAIKLRDEVSQAATKAEEALRAEQAIAKARLLDSLPHLDFQSVISACTDSRQIQYPVEVVDSHYETYRDNDGKYKQRIVNGAPHTVIQTRIETSFNEARFAAKYMGKIYKFDSDGWKMAKIEKDGTVVFRLGSGKALEFGQVEIRAIPSAANQGEFLSLKDNQRIIIKARIGRHDKGDTFSRVLNRIYLEDAELLGK